MGNIKNILIIPRHSVTLRFIELPSTDISEISQMVELQALKELPYPKEEIITSYRNMGSYKKGFSSIMLVIARRQIIEKMMSDAKERPESVRLETELLYLYLLNMGIVRQDKISLVIDIHKDYSEVIVLDKTQPVFSRGFSNEEFFKELERSIFAYNREKNARGLDEVAIIYHSKLAIEHIKPHVKEYFTSPINFYEYKEDLGSLKFSLEIDLLPKEIIEKKLRKENTKEILLTYVLLLAAVVVLASFFIFKLHEKNGIITMLSEKINRMQPEVDMLNNFIEKIDVIKSQKEAGELIIDILKESYRIVPGNIFLSGMDYDGKDVIYYKGMTKDMSSMFNFTKVLEKSRYFKKVEVKYATRKKVENQEFTDFSIACELP